VTTRAALALPCLTALTSLALAFAPAPLPRRDRRGGDVISIHHLQGRWKLLRNERIRPGGTRIELDGPRDGFFMRFVGDLWTYAERDGADDPYSMRVTIRAGRGAVAIDFYHPRDVKKEKQPLMVGLIRRRGDVVEVLGFARTGKEDRPSSFEEAPPNWWVMTLQRIP
jgi:hypothetical protein